MYHQVVRRVLATAFAGLNKGNIQAVTGKFAVDAEHTFIGQHALSGTRRTSKSIYQWYERLLGLFPDIQFQLHHIQVQGPPWSTLATIEWSETNTGTDGVRTHNEGVNVIELAWGKVRRVRIYTDTAVLTSTLNRLAAAGNQEAAAPRLWMCDEVLASDLREETLPCALPFLPSGHRGYSGAKLCDYVSLEPAAPRRCPSARARRC